MKKTIIIDTECYLNYWLFSAGVCSTGAKIDRVVNIELTPEKPLSVDDKQLICKIMRSETVGFNSRNYDLPLICLAVGGANNAQLKALSDKIIKTNKPAWMICRDNNINVPKWDNIDIIDVSPGTASLKLYAARLGFPTVQNLPIDPDEPIATADRQTLIDYCAVDLGATAALFRAVESAIDLRREMSAQYGMDLRSKSDAQIAEAVIKSEVSKVTGKTYYSDADNAPEVVRYTNPGIIEFGSAQLNSTFDKISNTEFRLNANGRIDLPAFLKKESIIIGGNTYQMGIGGLHSTEKQQFIKREPGYILADYDVASYYPSIILQQRLGPPNMGKPFQSVYKSMVERRLAAKSEMRKITNRIAELETRKQIESQIEALKAEFRKNELIAAADKTAINASFGKFGSRYSTLYSPELLIQTTITGQLALMMLIERMTDAGVRVVSANTDGIVLYYPESLESTVDAMAFDWELRTSYELERTDYDLLASRDVNNYIAVTPTGKIKSKGVFKPADLSKNPKNQIVYDAVKRHLAFGDPIEDTILFEPSILPFISAQRVTGGATWRGEDLGKVVRFYKSSAVPDTECIRYAKNNNTVPKSQGARPVMILPDELPNDIDYDFYINEAYSVLQDIGYA
ncbi:MAG: hypothetical protein IBX56_08930 [Methylomicrobium sp.]|nr:hypothetical protein [Methylomicrobium sp.]